MSRHTFSASLAVSMLAAQAPTAMAQEATTQEVAMEEIVVTGSRFRAQEEIAQKRDKDLIFDSLSQDEIAAVPDFNVADALRRIAGIATQFDEDEGRFVNVRGIDANLNYVTFDGIGVPSTGNFGGAGRNVNIEFFPSTAVKRLDVYKTFTPDLDGGSIGGYIDVVTRSAFDQPGTFFVSEFTASYFTADDIADDQDEVQFPFRIESTFATQFGPNDQFGVVLTGLYGRRPREQDRLFTVGSFETQFPDVQPPTRFDSSLTSNNQERYGGQGKLEFRRSSIYSFVSGYFYRQQEDETRFRNNLRIRADDLTQTGPGQAELAAGRMELNFDYFPIRTQGKGVQGHFESALFGGNFDFDIGWAEQNFDHDTPALVFRTPFVPELGVSIDASDVVPTRSTFNDPSFFTDPDNYALSFIRERDLNTDEEVFNALTNWGWNNTRVDRGFGFKTGLAYRNLERVRDNEEFRFSSAEFADFAATADLAPLLAGDSFQSDFSPENFLFYDIDAARSFIANANIPRDVGRSTSADFTYEEDILAAYGMVTYRTDRLNAVAGVRYEYTDFSSSSRNNPANDVNGSFDHFLPSVNVSYELLDGLFVRGAYSRSLGRPNPSDVTASFVFTPAEDANNALGLPEVTRGNPDLEPRIADNFDLSLEYYFNNGEGLLSVAVFRKEIDDDIIFVEEQGVFEGQDVLFNQNANASQSQVQGIELQAYMGSMPFLPAPFQGLGFSANATFLDGETEFADGTVIDRRFRQADFLANVSVFYNIGDFEARVAYNYTDDFLIVFNPNAATTSSNRVDDAFSQVDASIRYYYGDHVILSLEGRNLSNDRRTQLTGSSLDQLFGETIIGRQFHFGVAYRY